jgi:hypothetical protein
LNKYFPETITISGRGSFIDGEYQKRTDLHRDRPVYQKIVQNSKKEAPVLAWNEFNQNNKWAIIRENVVKKNDGSYYALSTNSKFFLNTNMNWKFENGIDIKVKTTFKSTNQENMVMETLSAIPGTLAKVNANVEAADGTKLEKHDILEISKLILTEDNQKVKVEFNNTVDNKLVHLSLQKPDQIIIIQKDLYEALKFKALKFKVKSDAASKSEIENSNALKSEISKSEALGKEIQQVKMKQQKTTDEFQRNKEELQQNKDEFQQNKEELQKIKKSFRKLHLVIPR